MAIISLQAIYKINRKLSSIDKSDLSIRKEWNTKQTYSMPENGTDDSLYSHATKMQRAKVL